MFSRQAVSRLIVLASASAGLWALLAVLTIAPATNSAIRGAGVSNDWRRVSGAALYDAGTYYREHAYIIVNGIIDKAQRAGGASVAISRADVLAARDLFRRSIARSPGDALSWAGLALVSALLQDQKGYVENLVRSADLAPYNLAIARVRLTSLAAFPNAALNEDVKAALSRDFQVSRGKFLAGDAEERLLTLAPFLASGGDEHRP